MTTIHTLVFADQDAFSWGACWLATGHRAAPLAWRTRDADGLLTAELREAGPSEPWRLEGDAASLVFTPSGPSGHGGSPQPPVESLDQVCAVSGTLAVGGSEREIECLGWRSRIDGSFDLVEIDTLRQTYGWFDAADGVAVVALRPRKARGHETDLVTGAVLDPERVGRIADPRLSTTYDAAGVPARVGLELWFESEVSAGDSEEDEGDEQPPRRAAGEAVGDALRWEVAGFTMQAVPLRWHSRGHDGIGLYLLGQHA